MTSKSVDEPFCWINQIYLTRNCIGGEFAFFQANPLCVPLYTKPQPTSQDGFVLVPIEPTEDMIKELMHEWDSVGATSMYENYAAMIQALSPKV